MCFDLILFSERLQSRLSKIFDIYKCDIFGVKMDYRQVKLVFEFRGELMVMMMMMM